MFHDMDTVLIRFSGAIEFEEWLTPFVPQNTAVSPFSDPYQPGLKTVSFIGTEGADQVVASEGGLCFTGLCTIFFSCVTGCDEPAGRLVERINYVEAVFEPRGAINVLETDIVYPYLTFRSSVTRRLVAIIAPGSPSPDSVPQQIVIRPLHK